MTSRYKSYYEIGGTVFSVETPRQYEEKEPYSLFRCDEKKVSAEYVYSFADTLPPPCGVLLREESYFRAYDGGDEIIRYAGFFKDGKKLDAEYARIVYPKNRADKINVTLPLDRDVPMKASIIYRTLCLEHMLLSNGGMIFHSSYIGTDRGAILFTAPSGTGKSTQAELWRRYRGADVVNGDCSVLKRNGEKIWAYGLPFSGTSGICRNMSMPVRAVVYLTQAPENRIETLGGAMSLRALIEGAKFDRWESFDAARGVDIASDIAIRIPILKLDCVPDESAVELLEKKLAELDV